MPSDTGSNFLADLRFCLRRSLLSLLPGQGLTVRNDEKVGRRRRQIAEIRDITPLKHYSAMYKQEYVINAEFCFRYGFDENSLSAADYVCGGQDRPSLLPFRTIQDFSIGNIAINTGKIAEVTIAADQVFRVAGIAYHNGSRKAPRPFLAFLGIHFDFDRLQPLLDQVTAALSSDYLALDEIQSCSTPVLWIARDTGDLYTCRCFDGTYSPRSEWTVRDNLCCLCTKRVPRTKCGHKMYYTPFQQTWNPYFPIFRSRLAREHPRRYQRTEDIKTLNRDAENALREFIGHLIIGEKWREETELFRIVSSLLTPRQVIHHYRGDELFGLEYDIYVPELRLAIEYHGQQHFQSVSHWGGADGLAKRKENDARKRRLSLRHAVDLVEFTYQDEVSAESVERRLRPFLENTEATGTEALQRRADADRVIKRDAERGKARRREKSRTLTLWRPHLEPEQVKLFNGLLDWGRAKVTAQEPFDVLAVFQRETGDKMEKFCYDTVEESLRQAQREIAGDTSIRFYALAMLYSVSEPDEERQRDGFMVATERNGLLSSLFVFCEFARSDSGDLEVTAPNACYRTDQPILRANRDVQCKCVASVGTRAADRPKQRMKRPRNANQTVQRMKEPADLKTQTVSVGTFHLLAKLLD